jgi:MarR family transcriptional regulator for hemolysin
MMSKASQRNTLGSLIGQTARVWRRAVDRRLQPFGLTEASWLPLLHVARSAVPMRQKDLAASLSLDGSSVVRILDALQAGGFIERREENEDRRAKVIVLTKLGRTTVDRVEATARQVRNEALASLSDREIETTARTLEHICRALSRDPGESKP